MVSFLPWPLYPGEKTPSTPWIGSWVGPRASVNTMAKRKIPCPCQKLNSSHPAHDLVTILRATLAHILQVMNTVKLSFIWAATVGNLYDFWDGNLRSQSVAAYCLARVSYVIICSGSGIQFILSSRCRISMLSGFLSLWHGMLLGCR